MKDFDDYLNGESPNLKRALTDRSYRKYTNDHTLPFNDYLSTLGDAVLRLCLTDLLSGGDSVIEYARMHWAAHTNTRYWPISSTLALP